MVVTPWAGPFGRPALNLPRPSEVPSVTLSFSSSLLTVSAPTNRGSCDPSKNTSLPLTTINLADVYLSNLGAAMTPTWKNGGAQLNAYDRLISGVVGAITLSYPNGVNMRP